MSYRSKRTISNLATDASKRQKKPTPPLVSQSSTAANTATPPPPPNEANDTSESKKLIKQLPPKGSSTTTFSRDNNDRIAVKPPDHVQQERIRLTAQLQHQKNSVMLHQRHENSRDTINMQQEGGGKATYMQQEMQESSRRTANIQQQGSDQTRDKSNNSKTFKTRLSFKIDGWPTEVEYDAKEEVLTVAIYTKSILLVAAGCCWLLLVLLVAAGVLVAAGSADANGKIQFVSGSIQPIDILGNSGVKYYVEFNELHQPIRKGGHILVRFLGSIAKMAYYCPIGALTWHDVEKNLKVQIVNKMRVRILCLLINFSQQRVGKCWRHYKHELKKTFFQPDKKTHEQHYDLVPSGHSRSDWIKLVDHWFSPKGQKLSQIGKEARSLQFQAHTMGSNSYANLRADYEAEHGKKMGLVEAWEKSHMRKDGSFVAGTITEDFLSDAKAKVDLLKLNNSSSSSADVEDEAFHSLMNGGDIPERPQVLKKENRELSMKNDENTRTLKTVLTQFSQILDAVRKGKASVELIDAAQSALHMAIPEGEGGGCRSEAEGGGGGGASVSRAETAAAAVCDGGACLCRPEAVVDC
ncbi:Mitogen-activated protein kinase 2 [Bienertia sinuspersici]